MLSRNIAKYIQSSHHKKFRDKENIFVAEGSKVVEELLISPKFKCKIICGVDTWVTANESLLAGLSKEHKLRISETELQNISLQKSPNNVIAVFQRKEAEAITLINTIAIMLDGIQDPGNLGTIIRIADWFGVSNIICSEDTADCYNPKVVQATMGSISRVNIIYTDLKMFIENNSSINIYAATLNGKSIYSTSKVDEGVILIGNEARGISEDLLNLSAEKITIPKKGKAESLNAAVAIGIILSHIT